LQAQRNCQQLAYFSYGIFTPPIGLRLDSEDDLLKKRLLVWVLQIAERGRRRQIELRLRLVHRKCQAGMSTRRALREVRYVLCVDRIEDKHWDGQDLLLLLRNSSMMSGSSSRRKILMSIPAASAMRTAVGNSR